MSDAQLPAAAAQRTPARWLGLANGLTSVGVVLALLSMSLWIRGLADAALVAWLLAVGIDQIDGTVARWTGSESRFGALLDAHADALTYGVAPAVFVATGHDQAWVAVAGALLALAVVWRCAHQSVSGLKDITVGVPACLLVYAVAFVPSLTDTARGASAILGALVLMSPVHVERRSPLGLALIGLAFLTMGRLLWSLA